MTAVVLHETAWSREHTIGTVINDDGGAALQVCEGLVISIVAGCPRRHS